ncbi:PP2C family serine/threonine-protein phosphatase [Desulforhabdus sp. TSK]|uniref:PP2C family protein-serine/threonine phosphatase n=1 Tax=Desulforhabdus sp. TSK TaxID=2925014 RepID=UPI001FC84705|nr:protein phosphatase 2C domain-containing protein [Desulforhabdus sp. TSK]GKT09134.1 hypothetical protein DSTSK_24390 [Desulforhabdus sp. TSK]
MSSTYRIVGHTEKGPVRAANEDHILVARFVKNRGRIWMTIDQEDDFLGGYGILLAVADGVGGEAGGAVASRLALTTIERHFYGVEKTGRDLGDFGETIKSAAGRANETLLALAAGRPELSGMGCTLTGICLTPHGYLVFNAGDSRVYRYRNGAMALTSDDSLTGVIIRAGHMSFDEAQTSPLRHTITNCLGQASFNLNVMHGRELRDGDIFLVCSDGVHDLVTEDDLDEIMASNGSLDAVMNEIVDRAVNRGGHDNISAILVGFGPREETCPDKAPVLPESIELSTSTDLPERVNVAADGSRLNEEEFP